MTPPLARAPARTSPRGSVARLAAVVSAAALVGCGAAAAVPRPAPSANLGVDRARVALHLSELTEVIAARCPQRSIASLATAHARGTGLLDPCTDAAAYDEARAWLAAVASETTEDETHLWEQHRAELATVVLADSSGACTEPDRGELRDALERAARIDALGRGCDACGPAQREMLTALALDVLRRARSRTWSQGDDMDVLAALGVFSLRGPIELGALFPALHGERAPECEAVPRTAWAEPETWVRGELLGSSAVVHGPPMLFSPRIFHFEGALFSVFSANMPLERVTAAFAERFRPVESLSDDPRSDAVWLEGIDGNSVALVLPGGRRQGMDDQLVVIAVVHPEAENAEAAGEGVMAMLASATRPPGTEALPGAPVILDDPSLPWLAHQTLLLDAWVYLPDPLAFVPDGSGESVLVTRTHSAPDCEVPSDFEGSAAEMTVFTVPACALFTRRRDRPDGPWTHTVVIPRREGALLIAQTLPGETDSALARALARLRTMRLAPP